jgi:hypothetical protein
MARAQATDPLAKFRYHLTSTALGGAATPDPLQPGVDGGITGAEAGFQKGGVPTYEVENADYREGISTYTHKFAGIPSTNEVTYSRGAARRDTAFFAMVKATIEGREYRVDLTLWHFTRPGRSSTFSRETDLQPSRAKRYKMFEAYAFSCKPAEDLEAGSSEIALQEIGFRFERWELLPVEVAA